MVWYFKSLPQPEGPQQAKGCDLPFKVYYLWQAIFKTKQNLHIKEMIYTFLICKLLFFHSQVDFRIQKCNCWCISTQTTSQFWPITPKCYFQRVQEKGWGGPLLYITFYQESYIKLMGNLWELNLIFIKFTLPFYLMYVYICI